MAAYALASVRVGGTQRPAAERVARELVASAPCAETRALHERLLVG